MERRIHYSKRPLDKFFTFRVLCGTIENENTFIVYEEGRDEEFWDDAGLDFWVIGADGVMFRKPVRKHIIVLAGGQRNEILLQFDKPGKYVISQQGIEGMQFLACVTTLIIKPLQPSMSTMTNRHQSLPFPHQVMTRANPSNQMTLWHPKTLSFPWVPTATRHHSHSIL
mmetsp:Transcript_33298/g.80524  ORF Transcript_33298/g.80524 Transcript_33298/m.80524 type:complete len:169 (+) Transcript_33298:1301-1807(+)